MKRRILLRKGMALLSVAVFTAGLCGCGTEEKSEEKKTLRVVTDGRLYDMVKYAERFTEGSDSQLQVEIQQLSDDSQKREKEIQKLRTEIMAGKGPDVYLLDGGANGMDEFLPLLENPYQTMQSGALAPLDKYMEKDSYWKKSTYHEAVLKAGQYDGRQYILPMSVKYYVLPIQKDMQKMTGTTLEEWVEQASNSQDARLKEALSYLVPLSTQWLQPAVDYKKREVLFDKEKWCAFVDMYLPFWNERLYDNSGNEYSLDIVMPELGVIDVDLQVVPDINGKKMASIMTYGAVGMSSDHKKEAYDFLMLFLNDRTQEFGKEHRELQLPILQGYLDQMKHAPVQESAFDEWLHNPSEEVLQKGVQGFRQLDGAYFLTNAEKVIAEGISTIANKSTNPDYDWSEDLDKLADNVWNTYKMMVSE